MGPNGTVGFGVELKECGFLLAGWGAVLQAVMSCPCSPLAASLSVCVCVHSPYRNPPVSNGICRVEQAERGLNTSA